jgi:hypothetical protein
MSFFFANPWGLLALSAMPAIVAIHFLQEKSRRVRTSTLFLLEHAQPTSTEGIRLERFRNSVPFWMQLLAALALAWLLADPRWIRADSRQTVAVVLDSSASMQAFREETLAALATKLRAWQATAARTDWHLLETGPRRPPLYAGRNLAELLAAAQTQWQPTLGTHPLSESLATAVALAPSPSGAVVLATDRITDLPANVSVLSVGKPFANVGISGGSVDMQDGKPIWRALMTNHGDAAAARKLSLRVAGDDGRPQGEPLGRPEPIALEAGQSRTLEGEWPAGETGRIVLALAPDRFAFDDTLPLVKPALRRVRVANRLTGPVAALVERMVTVAADVEVVQPSAASDLSIDRVGAEPTVSGVILDIPATAADEPQNGEKEDGAQPAKTVAFDPAWVAAEDHPLTRDLGWGGLLTGPAGALQLVATDEPLLWKGGRPLAFIRRTVLPGGRRIESLVLNFDLTHSTAAKTPAVVVMLQRFIEQVRREIGRGWTDNFETDQAIDLPGGRQARSPQIPGFFSLPLDGSAGDADDRPVVRGAAQFADSRESDFRGAAPVDTLDELRLERALKQSVEDPWAPLWVAVATAALFVAWGWRARS